MLSKSIESALNSQIYNEDLASQVYLAMASWAETEGYNGIAQFLYEHSDEERMHMLKLVHYVNERGGKAKIKGSKETPKEKYDNISELFKTVLKNEIKVSKEINALVDLALKEKDYATHNFLQWYVQEQLEEEALCRLIIDKINMIGEDKGGLYLFDKEIPSLHQKRN